MGLPYQRVNRPIRHIWDRIWTLFEARRIHVFSPACVYLLAPTLRSHSNYTTCGLRFEEENMRFARLAPEGRSLRRAVDENTYIRFATGGHSYICVARLMCVQLMLLSCCISSIVTVARPTRHRHHPCASIAPATSHDACEIIYPQSSE